MRHETITIPVAKGIDWKGIGYLFSIAGTLLLGAIAWPKPGEPAWHTIALVAGVLTSLIGFGLRYMAHLQQRQEIEQAKADAKRR